MGPLVLRGDVVLEASGQFSGHGEGMYMYSVMPCQLRGTWSYEALSKTLRISTEANGTALGRNTLRILGGGGGSYDLGSDTGHTLRFTQLA
jgi:hypothetical protein